MDSFSPDPILWNAFLEPSSRAGIKWLLKRCSTEMARFVFYSRRTFEEEIFKLRELQLKAIPCGNKFKTMRERTTFFKAKRLVSLVAV